MRKLFLFLIFLSVLCFTGCRKRMDYTQLPAYTADGHRINNTNDTIKYYHQVTHEIEEYAPGDTIYDAVAEGYPDTIRVAFTRNGVFEDSMDVVRWPGDDFGYKYVYVLISGVGDAIYYTREGQFLKSCCNPHPHAGQYHHDYKP